METLTLKVEDQRKAIAEFCGEWPTNRATTIEEIQAHLDDKRNLVVHLLPDGQVAALPDYLNSVDAMLTAVEKMDARQREVFAWLMDGNEDEEPHIGEETFPITDMTAMEMFEFLTKPASYWAKCFLRAVGKWEGES